MNHDHSADKITLKNLSTGPWDFYEHLSLIKEEIYLSKDIFYFKDEEFSRFSRNLYQSIQEIAQTIDESFLNCDSESIWDLFLINYESHYGKDSPDMTMDSKKDFASNKSITVGNDLVNNMMVLVINYSGKPCSKNNDIQKKKTLIMNDTKDAKHSYEKNDNVFKDFKSINEEKFGNRLQTVNNILKKLESKYFREKFEKDEDRIKGTSNLPFSYVVEMIKDINDVLKLYKDNLMTNVANALYKVKEP